MLPQLSCASTDLKNISVDVETLVEPWIPGLSVIAVAANGNPQWQSALAIRAVSLSIVDAYWLAA